MTTSGVTTLAYTANEIFTEALDEIGVAADGETLSGNYFARCKRACNLMIQDWKAQGMHLWTLTEGYLFLTKGTRSYDFASARLVNSYTSTTTSAAALTGASTITVTSATGIANGYVIGIELEDGTMQWTTVNGAPSGTTVTLTATLTDDVNSGASVFVYDSSVTFKPVERILQMRRLDTSGYEIEILNWSRLDYMSMPNKDEQSVPTISYADRQRDNYTVHLWPTPNDSSIVIPFTYERKIEVISDSEDTWDIPEYWFNALVLCLAVRVGPRFGVNPVRFAEIKEQAAEALDTALSFDKDMADVRFSVGH